MIEPPPDPPPDKDWAAEEEREARRADAWHDDRDERWLAAEEEAVSWARYYEDKER